MSPSTPPAPGDHPRSRGVYRSLVSGRMPGSGSSPLARGLHRPRVARRGVDRIIPARAGFTRTSRCEGRRRRDHPRSRGVYPCTPSTAGDGTGSSPLARGLREPVAHRPLHVRIIPARAGFTEMAAETTDAISDHPRSRGVYVPEGTDPAARQGSSPLARGLPAWPLPAGRFLRIIPARAGFTSPPPPPAWPTPDHPRSRGVYSILVRSSGS